MSPRPEDRVEVSVNESLLEERFSALETARAWSPRVMSRLEALVRQGDDKALYRVNPIRFAAERGIAEAEAIDLFLHATANGLFEMDWLLLCPMCACVVESLASLKGVGSHYQCQVCRGEYQAELDEYIAVAFTVSPAVRAIPLHHPAELPAADYCFNCRLTAEVVLPDGLPFVEYLRSVTQSVSYLLPGAVTRFACHSGDLQGGQYFGWDIDHRARFLFSIEGAPPTAPQVVRIRYGEDGCDPVDGAVAPGEVIFAVENTTARRGILAISTVPAGSAHGMLQCVPFLGGGRLLATQTFRDLFRSELIKATEGIGVRDITLVFTDLKGSTALYGRIGDLNAFSLVQQHFERLLDVTVASKGAVIKTLGDAVMAAFVTPADAVAAAIAMLDEIARFNKMRLGQELILKVGIHRGAAIAVTLNDRLDYFGQTVNIAARVQGIAEGDEICLTRDVHDAAGVAALLSPFALAHDHAQLKGVGGEMEVFRVGRPPAVGALAS
jgi:class 3 adenylate cyclase